MTRFFIAPEQIRSHTAFLDGGDAKHCYVLRLTPGDPLTLCDGAGNDYDCRITSVSPDAVECSVLSVTMSAGEPAQRLTLYCAFPKADKAEHIVQKATELGAAEINFFPSTFCVAKYDDKAAAKKLERWQKIAREAAQQSQRGIVPTLRTFSTYESALQSAAQCDLSLFCYENERRQTLASVANPAAASVSIITGSEGGFSGDEAQLATSLGCKSVTLGNRVLRCETAPLAVLAALTLQ